VVLARRRLIATAETVAGVGLLLVLLSGYVAWSLRLFGAGLLPTSVYFGMVCLVTAAVATAYRAVSHLIAPRYATVLVLQPVVPLLAYPWIRGATGWALVFVVVAALDLALAIGVTRVGGLAAFFGLPPLPAIPPVRLPGPSDPEPDPEPPLDSSVVEPGATTVLQELTWVLFAAAFGAALSYGSASLLTAHTVPAATRAAVVMLLAAAVGIGGAQVWRRSPANDVAAGLATLALVVSGGCRTAAGAVRRSRTPRPRSASRCSRSSGPRPRSAPRCGPPCRSGTPTRWRTGTRW